VVKGAPHPNAAKLFIEYLLSEEGQKVFREANYLPADPTIEAKTPTLKPDAGHFEVTTISPDTMERHLKDWTRCFSETFQ
jgi:iron(III) transport system substrate-binding protein